MGSLNVKGFLANGADGDLCGGQHLALRALAGALWVYTSNLHSSPDQASLFLGIDHRALRPLYQILGLYYETRHLKRPPAMQEAFS